MHIDTFRHPESAPRPCFFSIIVSFHGRGQVAASRGECIPKSFKLFKHCDVIGIWRRRFIGNPLKPWDVWQFFFVVHIHHLFIHSVLLWDYTDPNFTIKPGFLPLRESGGKDMAEDRQNKGVLIQGVSGRRRHRLDQGRTARPG